MEGRKTNPVLGMSYEAWAVKWGRGRSTVFNELRRGYCVLHSYQDDTHPLDFTYMQVLARCYNPNHPSYRYYGGRGIYVCGRWFYSFKNFCDDMGERPQGHTLDRIDVNGHYAPNNCRWADWDMQANNRSNNIDYGLIDKAIELRMKGMSLRAVASEMSMSYGAVYKLLGTSKK